MTRGAAILPSRDEHATISRVVTAVDAALNQSDGVLLHADASETTDTAEAVRTTPTRAHRYSLTALPRGKGHQIRHALTHLDPHTPVVLADTDTTNPRPETYRALLRVVEGGAAIAVADYPRYWDEANLTHHLARPTIAAATGVDVPQPLAGDIALAPTAWTAALEHWATLPPDLARCVGGYGIDAFLLRTAAAVGPVTTVPITDVKQHAPSFPHLPTIFHEAVPILLHPARTAHPTPVSLAPPRLADRDVPTSDLTHRDHRLADLTPQPHSTTPPPWPEAVATAWRAVACGTHPDQATADLWPHYLTRVRGWLAHASTTPPAERPRLLQLAMHDVLTALTRNRHTP